MKCKYCGQEISEDSSFCGYCGKEQPKVKYCVKCGKEIGLDDAFCGFCGASQNVEIQEVNIEKEEQEAPYEVVQTVNDESTEETTVDVKPKSQEFKAVDEADEKRESKEDPVPMISSSEQIEKPAKEEQLEEETDEDNDNESSEYSYSTIDFDEDDNSQKTKKYIIIALVAALVLFGGYGAYHFFFNKSDSDITNEEVINNKAIALKGTINNTIGFTMQLSMTGNTIEGTEHYDSQKNDVNLIVRGSKSDNGTISLSEYDGSTTAGTFEGTVENGVFSGNFTNAKGKTFPFYAEVSILDEEQNNSTETNDSSTDFATKHVTFKKSDKDAETNIEMDYPKSGNTKLVVAIRNFILETLVNTYTWDGPMPKYTGDVSDGQAVADFYGKTKMKMLKEESKREYDSERQLEESISINIKKETMKFVTYEVSFGGCHGGVTCGSTKGATFLKKDGKGIEIIKDPNNEKFKKLLIKYITEEAGLDPEELNNSFYENPMPKESPVLSFNGVSFNYYRGEIANMMAGYPSVTIPFDEIMPYLTDDAKEVINNN